MKTNLFFTSFIFMSIILATEQFDFNIGSAKHDYGNIDLSYNGQEGFLEFSIKKLSISTMNTNTEISGNSSSIIQFLEGGPSKIMLQGLSIDLNDNYSNTTIVNLSINMLDFWE